MHPLSYNRKGFPSIWHYEIRWVKFYMGSVQCPVCSSHMGATEAQISKQGGWDSPRHCGGWFFWCSSFNPFAQGHLNIPLLLVLQDIGNVEKANIIRRESEKLKHGSFSPLIFTTAGSMETTVTVVYKRLAYCIAEKHNMPCGKTLHWIRCWLYFSLLRSAVMCLRSCSTCQCPEKQHQKSLTLPVQKAKSSARPKLEQTSTWTNVTI